MERIRLRDSSDSRIMPSMPLYSSRDTYAPISAMDLTCNDKNAATLEAVPVLHHDHAVRSCCTHCCKVIGLNVTIAADCCCHSVSVGCLGKSGQQSAKTRW